MDWLYLDTMSSFMLSFFFLFYLQCVLILVLYPFILGCIIDSNWETETFMLCLNFVFVYSFFTRLNFFNLACFMLLFVQRWTALMVARSWHRDGLEEILSTDQEGQSQILQSLPSPYLSLPLMSIVKIARWVNWIDFTAKVVHSRNICNI